MKYEIQVYYVKGVGERDGKTYRFHTHRLALGSIEVICTLSQLIVVHIRTGGAQKTSEGSHTQLQSLVTVHQRAVTLMKPCYSHVSH